MLTLQRTEGNVEFRDLNNNGQLDPYEDSRLALETRVTDLLSRMTVAEKAGLMFQTFATHVRDGGASLLDGDISQSAPGRMVLDQQMNHFNFPDITEPRLAAEWQNQMQLLAEGTRLGIPITFATDPRHAFSNNPAVSERGGKFSKWPEPIGLAATNDPELVESIRRYRPSGVPGDWHSGGNSSYGRSGNRATLGQNQRHLWGRC